MPEITDLCAHKHAYTHAAALPSMLGIVCRRPKHFASPEAAVTWALKTGMCKSREAAAISVPSQLVFQSRQAAGEQSQGQQQGLQQVSQQEQGLEQQGEQQQQQKQESQQQTAGQQGEGVSCGSSNNDKTVSAGTWVWRTDLAATQPFWQGWFSGLSDAFLKVRGCLCVLSCEHGFASSCTLRVPATHVRALICCCLMLVRSLSLIFVM